MGKKAQPTGFYSLVQKKSLHIGTPKDQCFRQYSGPLECKEVFSNGVLWLL